MKINLSLRPIPRLRSMTALALVLLAGSPLDPCRGAPALERPPEKRDQDVMKLKLYFAQRALEAIATENYPLLATNALKLGELTQEVSWRVRQSPEYERLSTDFRRQTAALARTAQEQNVDAATVAYFQMTAGCVTCHKYLKGRGVPPP